MPVDALEGRRLRRRPGYPRDQPFRDCRAAPCPTAGTSMSRPAEGHALQPRSRTFAGHSHCTTGRHASIRGSLPRNPRREFIRTTNSVSLSRSAPPCRRAAAAARRPVQPFCRRCRHACAGRAPRSPSTRRRHWRASARGDHHRGDGQLSRRAPAQTIVTTVTAVCTHEACAVSFASNRYVCVRVTDHPVRPAAPSRRAAVSRSASPTVFANNVVTISV